VNLLSKMYGGSLKPADPRRFLIEAIMGAIQADGVVKKEELEVLEESLSEHEIFAGLSQDVTKVLIEIAQESMAFAGGPLRRLPYMARGLPSRSHRLAAYAVACEIVLADGPEPEMAEATYLDLMKKWFLLGDYEAKTIFDAAKKRRSMNVVEDLTEAMQKLMPLYIECMAVVASADGTVTAAERAALVGVLRSVGDMAILSDSELIDLINDAFRRIEGKDADREVARIAREMKSPSDRYWAAVYMMILAIADGHTDWRQVWLLGSAQEALRLTDEEMDRAFGSAKLFPIKGRK
jgi:tellurite resistance protein